MYDDDEHVCVTVTHSDEHETLANINDCFAKALLWVVV